MPDRPDAPPRSPFRAGPAAAAPAAPEDLAIFEELGYSPEELEPIHEEVVPLVSHWTEQPTARAGGADLSSLDALGEATAGPAPFVAHFGGGAARPERDGAAWADPFAGGTGWELSGGRWEALEGMGLAEVVMDSSEADWLPEEEPREEELAEDAEEADLDAP